MFPLSETGVLGDFWGRIKGAKYRFAFQDGTWDIFLIDLQLHEFHFRMGVQNFFQFIRRGMEGEADMLENAFRFLSLNPVPKAEIIKEMRAVFA